MLGSVTGVLSVHGQAERERGREQGMLRSDTRLMPAYRERLEIIVCLWAGIKEGAKVKFWHQKPFWDVIQKRINVWSSIRKIVAEFKRLQMAFDAFVFFFFFFKLWFPFSQYISTGEKLVWTGCTFIGAPVHYGLVHSFLHSNQSVPSSTGAHEEGRRQATTIRAMDFSCFVPFLGRLPSSLNPHFHSSAVLKHHFAIPSSDTYYCLFVLAVICDSFTRFTFRFTLLNFSTNLETSTFI